MLRALIKKIWREIHFSKLADYFSALQMAKTCLPYIQPLVRTLGYHGFVLYSTLGHAGGGNSCGGYTLMGVATTRAG